MLYIYLQDSDNDTRDGGRIRPRAHTHDFGSSTSSPKTLKTLKNVYSDDRVNSPKTPKIGPFDDKVNFDYFHNCFFFVYRSVNHLPFAFDVILIRNFSIIAFDAT
jgi:hypothetical protein